VDGGQRPEARQPWRRSLRRLRARRPRPVGRGGARARRAPD
jgi:hypothetical protein